MQRAEAADKKHFEPRTQTGKGLSIYIYIRIIYIYIHGNTYSYILFAFIYTYVCVCIYIYILIVYVYAARGKRETQAAEAPALVGHRGLRVPDPARRALPRHLERARGSCALRAAMLQCFGAGSCLDLLVQGLQPLRLGFESMLLACKKLTNTQTDNPPALSCTSNSSLLAFSLGPVRGSLLFGAGESCSPSEAAARCPSGAAAPAKSSAPLLPARHARHAQPFEREGKS